MMFIDRADGIWNVGDSRDGFSEFDEVDASGRVARITNVFDGPFDRDGHPTTDPAAARISTIARNELPNGIIPVSGLSFPCVYFDRSKATKPEGIRASSEIELDSVTKVI